MEVSPALMPRVSSISPDTPPMLTLFPLPSTSLKTISPPIYTAWTALSAVVVSWKPFLV